MSTSSLASCTSDGTSTSAGGASHISISRMNASFDKCPRCKMQFDFLKRNNNMSSKVPLILNCKHTVCEDCIRRLCLANSNACPVCNEKISVTRAQIDNLTELFVPHYTLIGCLMWGKNAPNKRHISWVSTGVTLKNKQIFGLDAIETNTDTD
ncbi:hypothetical protein BDFB_006703, partial [Asbolus verrucosus]